MEIWINTNANGNKSAWFFSFEARRAIRIGFSKAELMLATGEAILINKPSYVGGW